LTIYDVFVKSTYLLELSIYYFVHIFHLFNCKFVFLMLLYYAWMYCIWNVYLQHLEGIKNLSIYLSTLTAFITLTTIYVSLVIRLWHINSYIGPLVLETTLFIPCIMKILLYHNYIVFGGFSDLFMYLLSSVLAEVETFTAVVF